MSLLKNQMVFSASLARLIIFCFESGLGVTMGECYRTKEQAEWYKEKGVGIKDSLHCKRLAADINLFRDGIYLKASEDYRFAGDFWKSLNPSCRWGGDFSKPDGNHFEMKL